MRPEARAATPAGVLAGLALGAGLAVAAFMTLGVAGDWAFTLAFRAEKLAALALVGCAIAVSTVLFQTVTGNRILTPAIMGFDALFILIQTGLVFVAGAAEATHLDPRLSFAGEAAIMVAFSALLYRWLFSGGARSLHLLLLVGVILGVLFHSLSRFLQRVIDPNAFVVLQDMLFASFNSVDTELLGVAAAVVALATLAVWRLRHTLDVLALGRETAINLGIDHRRTVTAVLVLVAVLVSVSTALVGPVTFFGLLVANLAYQVMPSHRHVRLLPAAVLIAVICLVGGQALLEHVFGFATALSIIVEFVGGLAFILLVIRGAAR